MNSNTKNYNTVTVVWRCFKLSYHCVLLYKDTFYANTLKKFNKLLLDYPPTKQQIILNNNISVDEILLLGDLYTEAKKIIKSFLFLNGLQVIDNTATIVDNQYQLDKTLLMELTNDNA